MNKIIVTESIESRFCQAQLFPLYPIIYLAYNARPGDDDAFCETSALPSFTVVVVVMIIC